MSDFQKTDTGSYVWAYAQNLSADNYMHRIYIFITKWMLVGIIALLYLLYFMNDGFTFETFKKASVLIVCLALAFLVIFVFSYWLWEKMSGGHNFYLFELNEEGVYLRLSAEQHEKEKTLGYTTALLGAMTKNYGLVGAGLASGYSQEVYTKFTKVKSIKRFPEIDTIELRGTFFLHSIYADKEEYDTVLAFIQEHCPQAVIKK